MGITKKEKYRRKHAREKGKDLRSLKLRNTIDSDGSRKIVIYSPNPGYTVQQHSANFNKNFGEVIQRIGEVKYITGVVQGRAADLMRDIDVDYESPDLNQVMRDISDIASNMVFPDKHLTTQFIQIQLNGKKSDVFQFETPISQLNFMKVGGEYLRNLKGNNSWGINFNPQKSSH